MLRSVAFGETAVVVEEWLFAGTGSLVAEVTVAVLPSAAFGSSDVFTTSENVAVAVDGSEAMLQLTVPVAPAAGVVQVKVGPPVCVIDTNVVVAGTASVSVTLTASAGPLLVTPIV